MVIKIMIDSVHYQWLLKSTELQKQIEGKRERERGKRERERRKKEREIPSLHSENIDLHIYYSHGLPPQT